jgi:hypothetical protein
MPSFSSLIFAVLKMGNFLRFALFDHDADALVMSEKWRNTLQRLFCERATNPMS